MKNRFDINRRQWIVAGMSLIASPAAAAGFASRRISVTVGGSGSDVLLLPGLGAGISVWNGTIAAAGAHRWHRLGVRGFAGLAADGNTTSRLLEPLADEIARYVSESGLKRPAVIGHSMGGTLAMLAASRHPGLFGRIMVVDMLPAGAAMVGGTAQGTGFLANQLYGYFMGTEAGRRMFAQLLRDASPGGAASDPAVIAEALKELAEIDLTAALPRLQVPLTVVYALPTEPKMRAVQTQHYRSAYAGAKGATLVPIGPSGHMVMDDQPAAFAAAVKAFLGRTPANSSH